MEPTRAVLDVLLDDARATTKDVARQTGLEEAAVVEAIETLQDDDVVQGYQAIVDWGALEEEHVRAEVELDVTLDRETGYDDVAERLAKFPEVYSLELVSGGYDFLMVVEGDSMNDISRFISEQVAPVPEITSTVTHYVMETYKDRGVEFGDGDDDDDRLSVSP
jgi:DNA-binding Lrp family transcriptional regulator